MQEIYQSAYEWIGANAPQFIVAVVKALVLLLISKIVIGMALRSLKFALEKSKRFPPLIETFIIATTSKILWLVAIVLVLGVFVDVAPIIAGLGVTGFILGFAFQDSLSNLAAGLMILFNKPFEEGHFVDTGGTAGIVRQINLSATILHTPDNKVITIPNSKVWGTVITNFTAMDTRRIQWDVGISYGTAIGKTREVVMGIIDKHPLILQDQPKQCELNQFGDSSLNLVIRAWSKTSDFWDAFFQINQQIKEEFDKAGIEIPFPQMDIHMDEPVQFNSNAGEKSAA